ncbi:calcineurin-like phosphoesterase family protein [Rheinheimera fenheensis]|uniref:calcineurin-like phosphoesterase family protein n=1 Tax=Rheinheimera fenheensis TaxID=3152295 RepID=UPI00325F2E46
MKVPSLLTALISLVLHFDALTCEIHGKVFFDENENGVLDNHENLLPDVMLSNGLDIVSTQHDGGFTLKRASGNFIFVIDPAGYRSPLNALMHRNFYQTIDIEHSCDSNLHFPLVKTDISEDFSFAVFADPQPDSDKQLNYFKQTIINRFEGDEIDFGITLGDLVANDLNMIEPVLKSTASLQKPWYTVIGNHDIDYSSKSDEESSKYFEQLLGPKTYAFIQGKVGFLILDNVRYPDPRDGIRYQADLSAQDLHFAVNFLQLLPKDYALVIAFHMPLDDQFDGWNLTSRETLISHLNDFNKVLILSGHTHLQQNLLHRNEIGRLNEIPINEFNVGTTSGDWFKGELDSKMLPLAQMRDGTPQGYAEVHFSNTQYTFKYVVTSEHFTDDFNIYAPKSIIHGQRRSPWIYVNHYIGNELTKVEFRVGPSGWLKMEQVKEYDPSYLVNLFKWDVLKEPFPGNRPSNPEISTHLWKATLPKDLPLGLHIIEVRVTDMFGVVSTQQREVSVIAIKSGETQSASIN